jgi:RND superfamily putative drug exporter
MTERLARISARRPLVTIGIWVLLVLVAGGISQNLLPTALTTELRFISTFTQVEAQRADDLLAESELASPLNEAVLVQHESLTVDDQAFRARVEQLSAEIIGLGPEVVAAGGNYYLLGDERLVSADRQTTIISVQMKGPIAYATENAEEIIHVVDEADGRDGFRVLVVGDATIAFENGEIAESDLVQGERIGIPVAMLILLVLFGAVVAALMPIGLAVVSIAIATAFVAVFGNIFGELVFFVQLWVTMIGLAVWIDYSLFVVSRFREELARGLSNREAVARTGATANRTVFFSGATVVIALVGVLIVPHTLFFSMAFGAIAVVIVSVIATLTLLPAVLVLLGPRIDWLSLPFLRRKAAESSDGERHGFWEFITYRTMRFPVLSVIVVGGLLVWASVYYFDINLGFNGVEVFPEDSHARAGFEVLEEEFSFGYVNPARVVIDGNVNDPQVQAGIARLGQAIMDDPELGTFIPQASPSGDLGLMLVPVPGAPSGSAAFGALERLRNEYIPAAFAGAPATVVVGGLSAGYLDFNGVVGTYMPISFALILGVSVFLLLIVFRSIVIPIKAIIMNLLSVGAAYGLMVLVFQKGVGADLLGFQQTETIDVWLPLVLFAILFGLSMDYHVFMLSRIRERYDQTQNNAESVAYGLRSTASLITGAALIMVAVFSGFASGDMVVNQQAGFGLAVAVLLDATLVRGILVPASMQLLGKRNWYLPSWLTWLPDLRVEPQEA